MSIAPSLTLTILHFISSTQGLFLFLITPLFALCFFSSIKSSYAPLNANQCSQSAPCATLYKFGCPMRKAPFALFCFCKGRVFNICAFFFHISFWQLKCFQQNEAKYTYLPTLWFHILFDIFLFLSLFFHLFIPQYLHLTTRRPCVNKGRPERVL